MAHLLKPFEYEEPQTVEEALQLLSTLGEKATILAGGTDLLLAMKRGQISPGHIVCISNIRELDYIERDADGTVRIGALTTHHSIAQSPVVKEKCPFLATACGKIGGFQVRHMGTIGGNISKAGPSQDTLPSLLVLEGRVKLVSREGERIVPLDQFLTGPFCTVREDTELLTEIVIPDIPEGSKGCYLWVTRNTQADETLVGVAVLLSLDDVGLVRDIRIGLGSVAPTAIRAKGAEAMLRGRKLEPGLVKDAAAAAGETTNPRSRRVYRRTLTAVLVERAVKRVWREITGVA
jgi:aerobic carbon-monoxide dehydrogenase medium subunit